MEILEATDKHYSGIVSIFNYYIEHTNARFEEKPMSLEDSLDWFKQFTVSSRRTLLVALSDNKVVGFACSQMFRPSPAFEDTVEVTVYIDPLRKRRGLGSELYDRLFGKIGDSGVHRALCGIALPNPESVALHEKFGFSVVGIFDSYAKKHGKYVSSVWMEKKFG